MASHRSRARHRSRRGSRIAAIAVLAFVATVTAGGAAQAAGGHGSRNAPPGNNGTIKIDDAVFNGNRNTPHVGCEFWVNFFGYDGGSQRATLTFEPWAPTRGGTVAERETSWSIPSRSAGNQLDHRYGPVDLSAALAGVTPHPQQGYHVRLTVHVTGSQGADVKHKVFWVEACPAPTVRTPPPSPPHKPGPNKPPAAKPPAAKPPSGKPTPGVPTPPPPPGAPSGPPPSSVVFTPTTTTPPAVGAAPVSPTSVLGEQITPAQPGALARTGISIIGFVVLGALCVALGTAGLKRARTRTG